MEITLKKKKVLSQSSPGFQKWMQDAFFFFFCFLFFFFLLFSFLVNMLRSLSSSTIYLHGEKRSREQAGDEIRLLSDRAGHDILYFDLSYF